MPFSRYGYGYGFAESTTIYVAAVILLLHGFLCVLHIIWIGYSAPRIDEGWQSYGGLIALLLGTKEAEKGILLKRRKHVWKDRILVEKMSEEDRMKLESTLSASEAKKSNSKQKHDLLVLKRSPAALSKK
jgi:hypothetical protein